MPNAPELEAKLKLAAKLAEDRCKYKNAKSIIEKGGPTPGAVAKAHKVIEKFEHEHPDMAQKSPRRKQ
jgi:hypothetical protein